MLLHSGITHTHTKTQTHTHTLVCEEAVSAHLVETRARRDEFV